ncbi:Peroxidase 3 [Dichanthelium oligosanthes]|uniref:Peroxidase n=1 Tax=Dichanthelium oligosanthes TaxID=888268 RepID=A0A1E5VC31_9POAL|nr:Peroxidase 3 [Dichanthelium oligosanthes]
MSPSSLLAVHHHLLAVALVATTLLLLAGAGECHGAALKAHFYRHSCPAAEAVVRDIVLARVAADPAALPARLLRLFFHDCFVRGCDASVLIDSTSRNTAEKDAAPNASLGGFDVIDTAKAVLEAVCPGTVSCADIVALAARDAVSFQFGRDLWDVQLGRRDGVVSRASEALANVPRPSDNFTALEANFAGKGLDVKDLVILSGAHTIGVAHCNSFAARLSGSGPNSAGAADPTLNAAYAAQLRARCGPAPAAASNNATAVAMDPGSPAGRFDAHYYVNLKLGRGLFASDAALLTDRRAAGMIHRLTRQGYFLQEFRNAVRKMGHVGVLTGGHGEIRRNCRAVN